MAYELEQSKRAVQSMHMVSDECIQRRERAAARTAEIQGLYRALCQRIREETQNWEDIREMAIRQDPSCWLDDSSDKVGMVYIDAGDTQLRDLAIAKGFTIHAVTREVSLEYIDDHGVVFALMCVPDIVRRQTPSMKGYFAWNPLKAPRSFADALVRYIRERTSSPDHITVHAKAEIADWCKRTLRTSEKIDGRTADACDTCEASSQFRLEGRDWLPVTLCNRCADSDSGPLAALAKTIASHIQACLVEMPNYRGCAVEACGNGVITAADGAVRCSRCDPVPTIKSAAKT